MAQLTPLPVDVNILPRDGVPCEYRLLNVKTNKFVGSSKDGTTPRFVENWQEASYFSSCDHHLAHEEQTLEFQWQWMRDEHQESWMHTANVNDYRVHVVIGDSGL